MEIIGWIYRMNSGESGFYSPPDRGGGSLLRSTLSPFSSAASAASKLWRREKDKQEQCSVTSLVTHIPHGKWLVFVLRRAENRKSSSEKITSTHTQLTSVFSKARGVHKPITERQLYRGSDHWLSITLLLKEEIFQIISRFSQFLYASIRSIFRCLAIFKDFLNYR